MLVVGKVGLPPLNRNPTQTLCFEVRLLSDGSKVVQSKLAGLFAFCDR